jgi:O-antigen/teichoic acid export membrane protein
MLGQLFNKYKSSLRFKQVFTLLSVTLFNIPIGIASSVLVANYLGASLYGDFSFVINIFGFAIIIFDFGFFQAGNRALVLNQDYQKSKEYYGALFIYMLFLFIIMSLSLFVYSQFDNNLYEKGLYQTFMLLIPFGWLFILPKFFETILHADNKINELAISRLIFSVGHLLFYWMAFNFISSYKFFIIISLYLLVNFIIFIYLFSKLKPSFVALKERMKEILFLTKIFGFHVFIGSVFGVGITQLSGVLISYFSSGNIGVGHYSLALAFSSPLKLIPNTIATTHYKDFANSNKIPLKMTLATFILSATSLIILWVIIDPFINVFYGKEFLPVIKLTYISSIGMLFYGLADYFNRFLGANGKGNMLRNSAVLVGIVILIANILLIPKWAETGAAIAFTISGFIYLLNIYSYYLKYIPN